MPDYIAGSRRTLIEAAEARELARLARPNDPDLVARGEVEDALEGGALILDGLRRRPRWFDGRFLTGADLTRDQDYARARQADIARAGGHGVIEGLEVSAAGDARGATLRIEAGHGTTPAGEPVVVDRRRDIALLDLADSRRLNAVFGLAVEPRAPLGRRSGLFILGLRPVEFTANAIGAYPARITGRREVEDGDVVEAAAITLVPWKDGAPEGLDEARRAAAREIFLGEPEGLAQEVLPLAVVALDRGALAWIDMGLVRRETGADTPLQVSLGARPRALAEAFALQHRDHLAEVMELRRRRRAPERFAAEEAFSALPPAGPLPAAAVTPAADGFRQTWFPPEVGVSLGFAPEDEIAALIDETLTLPPLDLADAKGTLEGIEVAILAPVSRARLARIEASLANLTLRAEAPPELTLRRPADALQSLLGRRARRLEPATLGAGALTDAERAQLAAWTAAWQEAVAALPASEGRGPLLWHVRRRAVPREATRVGAAVAVAGDDAGADDRLRDRAAALGLGDRLEALRARATSAASAGLTRFLGAPALMERPALAVEALRTLELALDDALPQPADRTRRAGVTVEAVARDRLALAQPDARAARRTDPRVAAASPRLRAADLTVRAGLVDRGGLERLREARLGLDRAARGRLTEADVADAAQAFDAPDLGDGLARLDEARRERLPQDDALWLGEQRRALEVDRLGLRLSPAAATRFAEGLTEATAGRDADALQALIDDAL